MPQFPFAMFVSSVEGHVVSRYGQNVPIGVTFVPSPPPKRGEAPTPNRPPVWNEKIVALTAAEVAQYGHYYEKHFARGELKKRTFAEWEAQQAKSEPKPPEPQPA